MDYVDKMNQNNVFYDIRDSKAARSVDGTTASHVEEANQIYTTTGVSQTGYFIYRTTAGDASINTGPATLIKVLGHTVQTGHTDEVLTTTTYFVDPDTTLAINRTTWESYVNTDGTYMFEYDGSNWKLNDTAVTLADYGLTVTGTIANSDYFTVVYTQLVVGTLSTATPTSFVATGYNQYDAVAGYAHVIGNNQYRIAGTYSSLGFTTTIGGTTTAVTVTDSKFTPTEDGYIYVAGGVGDILIALVWSGIRDTDPFEAYETDTITIPTADASSTVLPTASYGMPSVGDVADELSFSEKKYIQRIGHYTYSSANLATVEALGVPYIWDNSDIFYVLDTPVEYTLSSSVDGTYTANDFGTEEFTGTTTPVGAGLYYGNNLVDKLRNLADIQTVGTGLTLTDGELTSSGGTPVQTTGTSQTDVMSQDATTKLIYPDIVNYPYRLQIGADSSMSSNKGVAICGVINSNGSGVAIGYTDGNMASIGSNGRSLGSVAIGSAAGTGRGDYSVAIGDQAYCNSGQNTGNNVAIGRSTYAGDGAHHDCVALGSYARATRDGEVNVGTGYSTTGYNSTAYRVIGGVHDGQDAHDAATVAQGNTLSASAPDSNTVGVLGQLWTDTTNMHTYQCTAISGSTYTWTQRW